MANYYSRFTGEQIDTAVGKVLESDVKNAPIIYVYDSDLYVNIPFYCVSYSVLNEYGEIYTHNIEPFTGEFSLGKLNYFVGDYIRLVISSDDGKTYYTNTICKSYKLNTPFISLLNGRLYVNNYSNIISNGIYNEYEYYKYVTIELTVNGRMVGVSPTLDMFNGGNSVDISDVLAGEYVPAGLALNVYAYINEEDTEERPIDISFLQRSDLSNTMVYCGG